VAFSSRKSHLAGSLLGHINSGSALAPMPCNVKRFIPVVVAEVVGKEKALFSFPSFP
jgi:hypothetical protein